MTNNQTEIETLGPAETLSAMENVLDLLADAQGRVKCGYIFIMTELIGHMKTFLESIQQPQIELEIETTPDSEKDLQEMTAE